MNHNRNRTVKLPEGWILCISKSNPGRKYFFNKKTGKSSWTQPQAVEKSGDNKQKGKKEKVNNRERSKKEEPQKKNWKRKSDSSDDYNVSNKKQKEEIPTPPPAPTPEKLKRSKNDTPQKCLETRKIASPVKQTPSKNIANARLSQLRAQLSSESQIDENGEKSPVKSNKHRISPKAQTEPQGKVSRMELKSPNSNDSKSTTSQSPSSDSFQSIPSPSQFFAANKIISSMKAQLPEEYSNKVKQKDTFADIEEGICNQTAEYPFMKHPATPPQFYEASKLVSAIKSKLTYKAPCKDVTVTPFLSAKDRMESLRARLSSEVANESFVTENGEQSDEAMDVDLKEIKLPPGAPPLGCSNDTSGSKEDVVLVVDTNIFIHELDFIKNVLNSHIKGYSEQPTLLIPWRVINELDRLKDNNNGNGAICKRAKSAMDYLYKSLPEERRIKGQSLRDANSHIYPCEVPDDEILNCCLQQAERGKSVILLSNDKNLCNKATINSVKNISLNELKGLVEHKPQPTADPDLFASLAHYQHTMHELLSNILESELRAKYNDLWVYVLFKAPPWTLADVLQCLLKHWIAVFNEVFPRIEHLITELRDSLVSIEGKDPETLTQSEVSNFKELCLDIARKCQIIPEYMELAKSSVDRLLRKCGEAESERDGEMVVIDTFEGLWTVFSSYCAKLSSGLGVEHSIEDKLPAGAGGAGPAELLKNLQLFSEHICNLTIAIKGALSVESEAHMEAQMSRLETVFKESLASLCMDGSAICKNNLRVFCSKCRNMLQEAYAKFSQLAELLEVCKNSIASN